MLLELSLDGKNLDNQEDCYVRLNYIYDSDYGVSSDGGI